MVTSIDGKVTGDFLTQAVCEAATEEYYRLNREYKADAFACGRVTMEESFTGGWYPDLAAFADSVVEREDYIADPDAAFFAVAFDRHGRLGWSQSHIVDDDPGYGNAHIIEVLCEDATDAYLAYLQNVGVSYLFAGKAEINLEQALAKLKEKFGINTLLLEGGSVLNGAFQREGLVDELSLVVAPIVAGESNKPLFDESVMDEFSLCESKVISGSAVWMRYKKTEIK
jgi:riboflavin biosynthesis pyrimidine reductase